MVIIIEIYCCFRFLPYSVQLISMCCRVCLETVHFVPAHLYFFQQQVPSELIYCVILYITTDHNSDRTQHIFILLPHYFCSKSIRYEVKRALLSTYWSVCLLIAYIKTPLVSSGSVMIILSHRKRQPQRVNASRHWRSGDTESQPKGLSARQRWVTDTSGPSLLVIKDTSTLESGKPTMADSRMLQPALAAVRLNVGKVVVESQYSKMRGTLWTTNDREAVFIFR